MAIACTNCGHELPRDDAHFCNNCGTLVPSHPFSAQSLSAGNASTNATRREVQKPVLREQMVHWPSQERHHREQGVQPPRQRTTRRIAPEELPTSPIAWPEPITHVSVKEGAIPEGRGQLQEEQVQNAPVSTQSSERELRVKVWEQDNPPTPLPDSAVQRDFEYTPTTPLEAAEPSNLEVDNIPTSQLEMPEQHVNEHVAGTESDRTHNIEYIDTNPVPNYAQAPQSSRSMHGNTPHPPLPTDAQQYKLQHKGNTPLPQSGLRQSPVQAAQAHYAGYSNVQQRQDSPAAYRNSIQEKRVPLSPASKAPKRQKSRVPFIILLALLGVLVLGGGAWAVLAQPFSVSPVTQPVQDFNDTGLGVALSYPTGWTVKRTPTNVLFADSSRTAQVQVQVSNDTGDAAAYVQQQAKKNNMTAVKPLGTTSFAGLTWQQIQGSVQQDGAIYTTTMLATTRGNRMYVLTQMAPQSVYADEESVVFSAMRNSLKFL